MRARAAARTAREASALVSDLKRAAAAAQPPVRQELRRLGARYQSFWIANALAVTGSVRALRAMQARSDVQAIEADDPVRGIEPEPQSRVAHAADAVEWNIDWVKAPDVWALGDTGQGIAVASADSGVQWDHPALIHQYRGWDGTKVDHNYNWWDAVRRPVKQGGKKFHSSCGFALSYPCDDIGHGTHTTGTMVGDDGAGNEVGVAPGAKWIACRNLVDDVGSPSTYLGCLQWLLAPTDLNGRNPRVDLRPDVVNNSYACPPLEACAPTTLQTAYDAMRAAGIFMATAAGNSGPSCSSLGDPPGIFDSAISVGATSFRNNFIAFFSSRGPVTSDGSSRSKPDLAAPGSDVRSSFPPNTYKSLSGTSMAAPHVAGAVALLWSAFPSLRRDVDQTEQILEQTALHQTSSACGSSGSPNNVYGYGTINILNAYNEAASRFGPP